MKKEGYEKLSQKFTELNLEVNAKREAGELTDDVELQLFRLEKDMQEANRAVNTKNKEK